MCDVPIRAVFKLHKSDHNDLIQLSQVEFAQFLIDQSQLAFIYNYSEQMYKPVFQFISQMARCIPGYQLHFQKKPEFWQLVKGELGV
jgi:hypothetical protein